MTASSAAAPVEPLAWASLNLQLPPFLTFVLCLRRRMQHPSEGSRRRDLRVYNYAGIACSSMKKVRRGRCRRVRGGGSTAGYWRRGTQGAGGRIQGTSVRHGTAKHSTTKQQGWQAQAARFPVGCACMALATLTHTTHHPAGFRLRAGGQVRAGRPLPLCTLHPRVLAAPLPVSPQRGLST